MKWLLIVLVVVVVGGILLFFLRSADKSEDMPRIPVENKDQRPERVVLQADDDVEIVGDYLEAEGAKYAAILLHMMPAERSSYKIFAENLKAAGMSSIAIDLRGHGESAGGPDGYRHFSDEEHQKSILDVEAASRLLRDKGFTLTHQVVVGASIGANLAIEFASEHPEVQAAVLLSPGLNYKGIETEPLIGKLQTGQSVLIVTSEDDQRSGGNNADMGRRLLSLVPEGVEKKLIVYQNAGHGTDMFGKEEPDLEQEIIIICQILTM